VLKVSDDKNVLAFLTQEGKVAVIIYNPKEEGKSLSLKADGNKADLVLKAKSINTIVFN